MFSKLPNDLVHLLYGTYLTGVDALHLQCVMLVPVRDGLVENWFPIFANSTDPIIQFMRSIPKRCDDTSRMYWLDPSYRASPWHWYDAAHIAPLFLNVTVYDTTYPLTWLMNHAPPMTLLLHEKMRCSPIPSVRHLQLDVIESVTLGSILTTTSWVGLRELTFEGCSREETNFALDLRLLPDLEALVVKLAVQVHITGWETTRLRSLKLSYVKRMTFPSVPVPSLTHIDNHDNFDCYRFIFTTQAPILEQWIGYLDRHAFRPFSNLRVLRLFSCVDNMWYLLAETSPRLEEVQLVYNLNDRPDVWVPNRSVPYRVFMTISSVEKRFFRLSREGTYWEHCSSNEELILKFTF